MKIFLDSDVLLDYLTGREPFLNEIKIIFDKGLRKELKLFTSSLIIANIHYFIAKTENSQKAKIIIEKLSSFIKILKVKSKFKDFEDSIQNSCASNNKMDLIITRNTKDFKLSHLPILTPKELMAKITED